MTTGYGGVAGSSEHRDYTETFNGTSSASPIVAGAVAQISSIAEAHGRTVSPEEMRSVLMRTSLVKDATQMIGGLPQVPAAVRALGISVPDTTPALENGDFELGAAGWTGRTQAINNTSYDASSGSYKALLNGWGRSNTATLETALTVPSTGGQLVFDYRVITNETSTSVPYDKLRVQLVDGSGAVVATLASKSNVDASDGWRQATASLSAHAGKKLTLRITGTEDAYAATTFLVDNFRVTA